MEKSNSGTEISGAGNGESSRTGVQGRDTGLIFLETEKQDRFELGSEQGLSEARAKLEDGFEPGLEPGLIGPGAKGQCVATL